MSKIKIKYVCSSCGYESLKWLGKCPSCESWNSFSEEIEEHSPGKHTNVRTGYKVFKLSGTETEEEKRIETGISEFDRVLGGGIVPGSVVLLGGDPGIGKSTLVMQAAAAAKKNILYVTGEESINQISRRSSRLGVKSEKVLVLAETELNTILTAVDNEKPDFVIIDSIQTVYNSTLDNAPGTVTQIRECTASVMKYAKTKNTAFIIIGHITKEGAIAGPKIMEHIVDTVLQFEGEKNYSYRILRSQKNRFGSTNEIGIFEMHDKGLEEVKNPSEIFIAGRDFSGSGSVITASMEGTRPFLFEVQALVTPSNFGNPQRVATGFDYRRLSILLAVLEKRVQLKLSSANVFLNMAGGIRIDEPAADLAVCMSIASSLFDAQPSLNAVLIGEVGLGGEIRAVGHLDKRIAEAEKLGFNKVIIPHGSKVRKSGNTQIITAETVTRAVNLMFR